MKLLLVDRAGWSLRTWSLWLLISTVACMIHVATLISSPPVFQDEVEIVDYGRAALEPDTDWAMSWDVNKDIPVLPFYYLGPVLQELAFSATQPSNFGPRALALLSAVLAATCALGWLLARGTPRIAALALSTALLLDPVFSESYRLGRIDGWAFACCLAACWLLRAAITKSLNPRLETVYAFLAGALLAVSPFLWITASMLAPLVLLELYYLVRQRIERSGQDGIFTWVRLPAAFIAGGALVLFLLLIPIFVHWESYLAGFKSVIAVQQRAAEIQPSLLDLVAVHDPIVVFVALIALLFRREYGLLIALVPAVVLMYQTMVYLPRIMYLLPYLLAAVAGSATVAWQRGNAGMGKAVLSRALVVLLLWNIGEVLVLRPVVAMRQSSSGSPDHFVAPLKKAIGTGPHRVLLEEWSAYYAGRQLGWKSFQAGSPVNHQKYSDLLKTMEFVILRKQPYSEITLKMMEQTGFQLDTTITFPRSRPGEITLGPVKIPIKALAYPTLLVYRNAGLNN